MFQDLFTGSAAFALPTWVGGWAQPLNRSLSVNSGFLANNCGYPGYGDYVNNDYHTGVDLYAEAGEAVYAIGAGAVFAIDTGWEGNPLSKAVYIKHTAGDGTQFLAVYGHVDSSLSVGAAISAGQSIGSVHNWYATHLHFGIRTSLSNSGRNGAQSCGNWPSTSGPFTNDYVDPEPFLIAHPLAASMPTNQGDTDVTDIIYFASSGSPYTTNGVKTPAVTIVLNSMWYQERPGAPLFKITDNYVGSIEYSGFLGARFSVSNAGRYVTTPTAIGQLIELRGESLQPAAAMAPLRTV